MHMAAATRQWTLDELHRLPDDGNKYELVRGELFVTPSPTVYHENLCADLCALLVPYVKQWTLGRMHRPRAVVRASGSEVEPDLMVRPISTEPRDWAKLPLPLLVVEVLSSSTRRRDLGAKRDLYMQLGIADYWIVDRFDRVIRIVRPREAEVVCAERVAWQPVGAGEALVIDVPAYFRDAVGE
jgi:Uma2 family endonuclease